MKKLIIMSLCLVGCFGKAERPISVTPETKPETLKPILKSMTEEEATDAILKASYKTSKEAAKAVISVIAMRYHHVPGEEYVYTLGEPFDEIVVPYSKVEVGDASLLRDSSLLVFAHFPVYKNAKSVGSATVYKDKDVWKTQSYSTPSDLILEANIRQHGDPVVHNFDTPEERALCQIVTFERFNVRFVAFTRTRYINMYPIFDYTGFGFKRGTRYDSEDVWDTLKKAIPKLDNLPG